MTVIRLDRSYYAKHPEICHWLLGNIEPGGSWKLTMPDDWFWDFTEIFGHADVRFRRLEHAMLFQLTWC